MGCIKEGSGNNMWNKFQMTKNKSQINFNIQAVTYSYKFRFVYCLGS